MVKKNTKRGGGGDNDGSLNYSIGVLIILLMVFWFISKCIGNSAYHAYYTEPMSDTDAGLYYGATPYSIGGSSGLNYIRNVGGVGEVPNSKTAMRHLYDEQSYKCGSLERSSNTDDRQVAMHLDKQPAVGDSKGPRSKTASHELMCGSGYERDSLYL